MTNTTETQSTALLVIRKGEAASTERYESVDAALTTLDTLAPLMPQHTFGLIVDNTDRETNRTSGATFDVESASGQTRHGVPSYALARSFAKRYAIPGNVVTIHQIDAEADAE